MAFAPKTGRPSGQPEKAPPAGPLRSPAARVSGPPDGPGPGGEAAPDDLSAAVQRAARFGHRFAHLPSGAGPPASGAGRSNPGGVIQGALKVKFGSSGPDIRELAITGRPDWTKQVDKTLSQEASEKKYYNPETGKLRQEVGKKFVRGHIIEWNTRRRALQKRLGSMKKAELVKHLGLQLTNDQAIQLALLEHLKGEYNNPANLAITDETDHVQGSKANTLAQTIESRGHGSDQEYQELYEAAFNPGLSGKGNTQEKIEEYSRDFRDAWGVDPVAKGWHGALLKSAGLVKEDEEGETQERTEAKRNKRKERKKKAREKARQKLREKAQLQEQTRAQNEDEVEEQEKEVDKKPQGNLKRKRTPSLGHELDEFESTPKKSLVSTTPPQQQGGRTAKKKENKKKRRNRKRKLVQTTSSEELL